MMIFEELAVLIKVLIRHIVIDLPTQRNSAISHKHQQVYVTIVKSPYRSFSFGKFNIIGSCSNMDYVNIAFSHYQTTKVADTGIFLFSGRLMKRLLCQIFVVTREGLTFPLILHHQILIQPITKVLSHIRNLHRFYHPSLRFFKRRFRKSYHIPLDKFICTVRGRVLIRIRSYSPSLIQTTD